MKRTFLLPLFILFICSCCAYGQQLNSDSLKRLLFKAKEDTTRVNILSQLSWNYSFSDPDSTYLFAREGYKLAQSIGYTKGEMHCKENLAIFFWTTGDYATAAKLLLQVLSFAGIQNDTPYQEELYADLATVHRDQGDYNEALLYTKKFEQLTKRKDSMRIGTIYYEMNKPDSALVYLKGASEGNGWPILRLAETYLKLNNDSLALYYYRQSIRKLSEIKHVKGMAEAYNGVAELLKKKRYY